MLRLEVIDHNPANTLMATSANDAGSESQIPVNDIWLPATRLSPIQSDSVYLSVIDTASANKVSANCPPGPNQFKPHA